MALEAVIFDLDGVITDTAEYHFRAWKRLAKEEGIPFTRADNEQLRGVSRRESLRTLLKGRSVAETEMQELMARKNGYYQKMLEEVTVDDLLPGVPALLDELVAAGLPWAIASASRNARAVVEKLGIGQRAAVIADGNSVLRPKPAPDLFRFAAAQMNRPPGQCLVVEDAAAGVAAALAAGMPALALGPADRFAELAAEDGRFARRDNLAATTLSDLQAVFPPDPCWTVTEVRFDPDALHHKETVFTIGNGYFASRGSFEERYPGDRALTLAHGVFDDVPLYFTELANLPNWLDLRLEIDGHAFRLDQGELLHYARRLDLQQGVLLRHVRWRAPGGASVDLTFERFISYTEQHLGAIRLLATAVDRACAVTVCAGIDGHVANEDLLHWRHLEQGRDEGAGRVWLHSRTRHSALYLGAAATLTSTGDTPVTVQTCPGHPTLQLRQTLSPGQTLQVEKLVSFTTSRDRAPDAGQVIDRALATLDGQTYEALKAKHLTAWRQIWADGDVVVKGDDEAQLAIRYNLFQLHAAAPQHDDRVSIGAKTLSGLGYRGHVFWDTDIFIVPYFVYTRPDVARNLLMYRYHTLPGARRKAVANGYKGAQYAWESALSGDEVTPAWVPDFSGRKLVRIWTGDIQLHISADVAYAILQYWRVTGDDAFMRDYGAEIILDTARFWADRAEPEEEDGRRRYAFRDVIGPDEYHDHVDNNAYTNRMVQWHLRTAEQVLDWLREHHPQRARALSAQLELTEEELARWQNVADNVILLHDEESGLITQFENFFDLKEVDWEQYADRTQSLQVLLGIEGANKHQVLKQADVLMLLCLLRDEYDEKTWRANWKTYMPLTDHRYGSSLGPSIHAWAACEMNRPDEAYEHFMLAARADLHDVRGNAGDGIHAASAGGVWQAVVFGFAGLRLTGDAYEVAPILPRHWQRLAFNFYQRGKRRSVDISREEKGGELTVKTG